MSSLDKEKFTSGDNPGKGLYVCIKCGHTFGIDDKTYALPLCPNCQGTEYRRVPDTH